MKSNQLAAGLFGLYTAQGAPLGFALFALPAIFRSLGADLKVIGLLGLCMLPWAFKFVWSSFIENNRPWLLQKLSPNIAWIQLFKILSLLIIIALYFISPSKDIWLLLLLSTLLNLFYASQDIAIDTLAIKVFAGSQHVKNNVSQVAGFSFGMLLGGACTLYVFNFGWALSVSFLLLIQLFCHLPFMLNLKEFEQYSRTSLQKQNKASLWKTFTRRAWLPVILMALLFKMASTMGASLVSPLLIDMGVSLEQIALLSGGVLLISYMTGATMAGYLHRWFSSQQIAIAGLLGSAFCWLGMVLFLHFFSPQPLPVFVFFILEGFFFNICCVALFGWFMRWSEGDKDRGIVQPSTDFTLLQCGEVLGSTSGMILSGMIASYFGFNIAFAMATMCSFIIALVIYYCFKFSLTQYQGFNSSAGETS